MQSQSNAEGRAQTVRAGGSQSHNGAAREGSPRWVLSDEQAEQAVFGALLDAHPGPLTRHELATLLENPIAAHDAIGALVRDGIANASGELIFASRAAIRAEQLHL